MTRERMAAALATLAVALPGKEISGPLLEVYWRALADLTDEQLESAATKALRACKFFPTPAELLELARPRNMVAEAGRVFERVKSLAGYSPQVGAVWSETKIRLALGDAVADAYQAAGGASALMRGDEVWTRKAFVDAYLKAPPTDNPLLRIGPETPKRLPDPERRVMQLVKTIGNMPEPTRKDFKSAAAKDDA